MVMMSAAHSESADTNSNPSSFMALDSLQEDAVGPEPGRFHPYFLNGSIYVSLI